MGSDSARTDPAILAAIPHRPPFLFVDRIVERGDGRIVTEWDIRSDLFAFQGHYPGRPVLPGVLACEFCFQSAAILFAEPNANVADGASVVDGATIVASASVVHGSVPVLTRIEDARFKKIVGPGETLRAELTTTETIANVRFVAAHVTSARKTVLRVRFAVALVAVDAAEAISSANGAT